jgi:hypothetical protein
MFEEKNVGLKTSLVYCSVDHKSVQDDELVVMDVYLISIEGQNIILSKILWKYGAKIQIFNKVCLEHGYSKLF